MAKPLRRDTLICVRCGFVMKNLDARGNQPSGGLAFMTNGHYGSAVFDPMDGSALEINVCDPCLLFLGSKGVIAERVCVRSPKHKYQKWRPDGETP